MRQKRLLLCDDGAQERRLFPTTIAGKWKKMFLEKIEVVPCEDIVADDIATMTRMAISQVGGYDAVLLDIMWGTGSDQSPHGVALAKDIRERYPELPIIVFSQNVTLEEFHELIRIGISGYISKTAKDAGGWCAEIHGALAKAYEDRSGQPLYQELRSLLASHPDAWCSKEISEAASEVWRHDNAFAKWHAFWTPLVRAIGKMRLALPFDRMKQFFADDELFTLSVLPSMRGHLEHVIYVYFTGYIISHTMPGFREAVMKAVHDLLGSDFDSKRENNYWDLFQFAWLSAATLHDIAYPLEILPEVPGRCGNIKDMFGFAQIDAALPSLEAIGYDWASESGVAAKAAFSFVFGRLYGSEAASSFITENATFKSRSGLSKFNHGVASGALFIGEAKKWTGLPGVPAELDRFLCWASSAMALHALKHASVTGKVQLVFERDPLAFLLALCDELQVWNRSRPDDTVTSGFFRRVDLVALSMVDGILTATVEYTPFSDSGSDRINAAIKTLTASLNMDQQLLHGYLKPFPMKIAVHSRIRGVADDLFTVLLE